MFLRPFVRTVAVFGRGVSSVKARGLGEMKIPILAGYKKEVSNAFGVPHEPLGAAFRGLFLIDPKGGVRHVTVNDLPDGRSVDEAQRVLQAFQYVEKHGEVCPANWKPISPTIKPTAAKEYFEKVNNNNFGMQFGIRKYSTMPEEKVKFNFFHPVKLCVAFLFGVAVGAYVFGEDKFLDTARLYFRFPNRRRNADGEWVLPPPPQQPAAVPANQAAVPANQAAVPANQAAVPAVAPAPAGAHLGEVGNIVQQEANQQHVMAQPPPQQPQVPQQPR